MMRLMTKRTVTRRKFARGPVLIGILAFFVSMASPARASLSTVWHKMFPPENTGPKPEDTLVAPFADANDNSHDAMGALYKGPQGTSETGALSVPHRQQSEIAEWLTRAVPEIFDTDPTKYNEHLQHLATGMNPTAMGQYQAFMQSSNILQTLTTGHLVMHTYVEEAPVLLNSAAVEGRYRWLFEMPVTLTFLSGSTRSYEQAGVQPINQHVIVRVQVGRVPTGQGIDDMEIETFDVRKGEPPPVANQ